MGQHISIIGTVLIVPGKGTHDKVMAAIALLKSIRVEFNTLTVNINVGHPRKSMISCLPRVHDHIQFITVETRQ